MIQIVFFVWEAYFNKDFVQETPGVRTALGSETKTLISLANCLRLSPLQQIVHEYRKNLTRILDFLTSAILSRSFPEAVFTDAKFVNYHLWSRISSKTTFPLLFSPHLDEMMTIQKSALSLVQSLQVPPIG
jgi:hypothetical protein